MFTNGLASMRQYLCVRAAQIDRFCARLNSGLTAVAIVLAAIVLATAAFRAEQDLTFAPSLAQINELSSLGYPSAYD